MRIERKDIGSGSDFIFNEVNADTIGTSAQRLSSSVRPQNAFPLSIVICMSKVLRMIDGKYPAYDDISQKTLERELSQMTEKFRAVLYASTLEMSDVFSDINPEKSMSAIVDIDYERPETSLTSYMAESLGATGDKLYITAGFTLDTSSVKNLMKLLGRLDSVILPGYIKYFRLYRVTLDGTYLIGNDGEMFSSYCREVYSGNPSERISIDEDDSRYKNLLKIFKRTYCTKSDIQESVCKAFDESYNELIAHYVGLSNTKIDAQKLTATLFEKLKGII